MPQQWLRRREERLRTPFELAGGADSSVVASPSGRESGLSSVFGTMPRLVAGTPVDGTLEAATYSFTSAEGLLARSGGGRSDAEHFVVGGRRDEAGGGVFGDCFVPYPQRVQGADVVHNGLGVTQSGDQAVPGIEQSLLQPGTSGDRQPVALTYDDQIAKNTVQVCDARAVGLNGEQIVEERVERGGARRLDCLLPPSAPASSHVERPQDAAGKRAGVEVWAQFNSSADAGAGGGVACL
ncbi:uncharacterized protein BcabD6B2_28650 [Babesia caballi]|uniref:Uncharacterized protein n=1 Tax=Babesia caballi TaxID=5871 RepID=A0AAV4LU93_BABCB|nr:hypothetical protein, conserved [Babesia caballi]